MKVIILGTNNQFVIMSLVVYNNSIGIANLVQWRIIIMCVDSKDACVQVIAAVSQMEDG